MPRIEICRRHDRDDIPDANLTLLGEILQRFVAEEFPERGERDTRLTTDQIEVRIIYGNPLDINTLPLEITIFLPDHPAQRSELSRRRERIAQTLRQELPMLKGNCGLWILVMPASYGAI